MLKDFQLASIDAFNDVAKKYEDTIGSLSNYDHCYDRMVSMINDHDRILDLACGPGNVSRYIGLRRRVSITGYDLADSMLETAKRNVPDGTFLKRSIVDFEEDNKFDWIINSFGFPFLDRGQRLKCIECCSRALKTGGHLYLSFMDGNREGYEKTCFTGDKKIYFIYHDKKEVLCELKKNRFETIDEWELDFDGGNGKFLKDVVFILRKTT